MNNKIIFEHGISNKDRKYAHLVLRKVKGEKKKLPLGIIYVDSHNVSRFTPYINNFEQMSLDEMTAISYKMSQLHGGKVGVANYMFVLKINRINI